MRFFFKCLATLFIGIALGLGATWLLLMRGGLAGEVQDGPWRTSLLAGSVQSGPYLRAAVALHGLFALNRSETIYYTATTDDAGDKLSGRCVYTVTGHDDGWVGLPSQSIATAYSTRQPAGLRPSGYGRPQRQRTDAFTRSASEGWWSITAYGADDFLIPNPEGLYSVSMNAIVRRADGGFTVRLSRNAGGAEQIATGDGAFSLTLRLYNPAPQVAADPAHVALPSIRKESCA